jgi:hypothetical protein
MCKTHWRFGARLFLGLALVLALFVGCGGDKGNPAKPVAAEYTLTIDITPDTGGTVSPDPRQNTYKAGDTVILTAMARFKHRFIEWVDGNSTDTANPLIVRISGNKRLTARFLQIYNLTINSAAGGQVSRLPEKTVYTAGDTVVLTAEANDGYVFNKWTGASTETTPTIIVVMDGDKALTPTFFQIQVQDSCAANPYLAGCPQYIACQANPAPGCPNYVPPTTTDTCTPNPKPGCANYCTVNPTAQGCPGYCPPTQSGCPGYVDPSCPSTTPGCPGYVDPDPCEVTLTPDCPGYCAANPTAQGCVVEPPVDTCTTNPKPGCANYCTVNPTAAGCVVVEPPDTCTTNPKPGCPNYIDPCTANPYLEGCPAYIACQANLTPNCPGYCAANPTAVGCVVVEPPVDPCDDGPTAACCAATPSYTGCSVVEPPVDPCDVNLTPDCPGYVYPVTGTYCYWPANGTKPVSCEPIGGQYCTGSTCSEDLCEADYGTVIDDCANPPAVQYYCDWKDGHGCIVMTNPDAINADNAPMTEAETCKKYGGYFGTSSTCDGYVWVPPTVVKYCNWGAGNCWNIGDGTEPCVPETGGTCTGTKEEHCIATTTGGNGVVTCSGDDRPVGGACCAH